MFMKVSKYMILEEKGFNGDSAETALLTHDKDMTKVQY